MIFNLITQFNWPETPAHIKHVHSSVLNANIYIFSDTLKLYRREWLEWFPTDVIYLEQEITAIKDYGYYDQLFINTYNRKKENLKCLK